MDTFVLVVFAVGSLLQLALVTTSPRLPYQCSVPNRKWLSPCCVWHVTRLKSRDLPTLPNFTTTTDEETRLHRHGICATSYFSGVYVAILPNTAETADGRLGRPTAICGYHHKNGRPKVTSSLCDETGVLLVGLCCDVDGFGQMGIDWQIGRKETHGKSSEILVETQWTVLGQAPTMSECDVRKDNWWVIIMPQQRNCLVNRDDHDAKRMHTPYCTRSSSIIVDPHRSVKKKEISWYIKSISQTGNRTPAAAVKAPNPNH